MNTESALNFLKNIAKVAYDRGEVRFTPKDHQLLLKAIKALEDNNGIS